MIYKIYNHSTLLKTLSQVLIAVPFVILTSFSINDDNYLTLEQFGGEAYYKPLDGRLEDNIQYPLITFTPFSVDNKIIDGTDLKGSSYTKITAETDKVVFTKRDFGKSFCGLFAHQNPSATPRNSVDAFFPQEIGSRYSKIVKVLDAQNVLVDFEFNGGNREGSNQLFHAKGYVFYDNSDAWRKLIREQQLDKNTKKEIRLRHKSAAQNFVQSTYVIPQYSTWILNSNVELKIWSSKPELARLKIGYEDYYQHEKDWGNTILKQDKYIFSLKNVEHNDFTFHGQIVPPHRRILEANTWHGGLINGRKKSGITAFVGCNQLIEEESIKAGTGLTNETFISFSGSAVSAGGKNSGEGVAKEIEQFGYVLFKDYQQRGQMFTQMNATYGGGNFLVVENADIYFKPQSSVNPTSQSLKLKINRSSNAYEGFHLSIVNHKSNYLPYVFEIEGPGNYFKVFALGGSNRLNILAIQGSKSVYTFTMNTDGVRKKKPGEFNGYWDFCYVSNRNQWNWGQESKKDNTLPARISNKMMVLEVIPQKGKRYTVGRDYVINESFKDLTDAKSAKLGTVNTNANLAVKKPKNGQTYSNVLRTAICWTTVLQKYGNDIDQEKDIPKNGKPLALQPGDQFRIPSYSGSSHNSNFIYTITRKDRGKFPMFPAEFVGIEERKNWKNNFPNAQSYRYFWCQLDQDLPSSVGLTFEIEMVFSGSEELLDGEPRDAYQTYKGVGRIGENGLAKPNTKNMQGYGGYDVKQKLTDIKFTRGEPLGHMCYSQAELTEWYKKVNFHNGFYRENSNKGSGFDRFLIKNELNKEIKVNPLARYSAGKTFINCSGGPIGQYSNKLKDFYVRDQIQQSLGISLPESKKPKMRLYNSPEVRTEGLKRPEQYLEKYSTDKNAPDMPKACRDLLNSLPQ